MNEGLRLLLEPIDLVKHDIEAGHVLAQFPQVRQIALDLVLAVGTRVAVQPWIRLRPPMMLYLLSIMIDQCTLPPADIAISTVQLVIDGVGLSVYLCLEGVKLLTEV